MNIPRNKLLQLANIMRAPNFQNLQKRGQLPFPEGSSDDKGYSHPLAIVLCLSEVANKFTGMERHMLAKLFRTNIGKLTDTYRTFADKSEETYMCISLVEGYYQLAFGDERTRDTLMKEDPDCFTAVKIGEVLRDLKGRYDAEGLVV